LYYFFGLGHHRNMKSWKRGLDDSILCPKCTKTFWGAIPIVSYQYDKKMFRSNFDNFFGAGQNRPSQSWKPEPDDYVWHPKHTHTICGAVSIVSCQYGRKIIRSSFVDFSGLSTTEAGKVENWARMTLFCTRNIPTLFGTQFLSFCD